MVNHVADSHVNAYIRTRWALTEENPMIKAYDEVAWAELSDAKLGPIEPSLALLQALHLRWVSLLRALIVGRLGSRRNRQRSWTTGRADALDQP